LGGSAFQNGNQITLTPSVPNQRGAVWTQTMQTLGNGFSVTCSFRGTAMGGTYDADQHQGVDLTSFVIQTIGNNIASVTQYSDFITYPRIRLQFDGYRDAGSSDPSSSSVKLIMNGQILHIVNVEVLGIRFRDQAVHYATISYEPQLLTVVVDGLQVMNYQGLNIGAAGLANSYIGFECYSGVGSWAEHDLLSWSFHSIPEPMSLVILGLGGLLIRRKA